jgi:hypothetical protein
VEAFLLLCLPGKQPERHHATCHHNSNRNQNDGPETTFKALPAIINYMVLMKLCHKTTVHFAHLLKVT